MRASISKAIRQRQAIDNRRIPRQSRTKEQTAEANARLDAPLPWPDDYAVIDRDKILARRQA